MYLVTALVHDEAMQVNVQEAKALLASLVIPIALVAKPPQEFQQPVFQYGPLPSGPLTSTGLDPWNKS
jgi:hypothetical protein